MKIYLDMVCHVILVPSASSCYIRNTSISCKTFAEKTIKEFLTLLAIALYLLQIITNNGRIVHTSFNNISLFLLLASKFTKISPKGNYDILYSRGTCIYFCRISSSYRTKMLGKCAP